MLTIHIIIDVMLLLTSSQRQHQSTSTMFRQGSQGNLWLSESQASGCARVFCQCLAAAVSTLDGWCTQVEEWLSLLT